jgi:hypothetical protein
MGMKVVDLGIGYDPFNKTLYEDEAIDIETLPKPIVKVRKLEQIEVERVE